MTAVVRKSRGIRRAETPYQASRKAYDDGMPLGVLRRRMHLTESELRDIAPEEFDDDVTGPEGCGGY